MAVEVKKTRSTDNVWGNPFVAQVAPQNLESPGLDAASAFRVGNLTHRLRRQQVRIIYPETSMIRFLRQFDSQSIRLLIFDLDGTLIDSRLDLIHSVNATLRHFGRRELAGDVIASYVGDGAPALVQRALGRGREDYDDDDEALFRAALEYFLGYYRLHKLDHTTVYEGVHETLGALANGSRIAAASAGQARVEMGGRGTDRSVRPTRQMAVLSNKPVRPSQDIVQALGLGHFFVRIYGGNSFATKKPDPLGVRFLLKECELAPEQTVIIGDSHIDVETGRNSGIWTCGVTYGFAPHTLKETPPDVVVDHPWELGELFAR